MKLEKEEREGLVGVGGGGEEAGHAIDSRLLSHTIINTQPPI